MKTLFEDDWERDLAAVLLVVSAFLIVAAITAPYYNLQIKTATGTVKAVYIIGFTYVASRYLLARFIKLPSWAWMGIVAPAAFEITLDFQRFHADILMLLDPQVKAASVKFILVYSSMELIVGTTILAILPITAIFTSRLIGGLAMRRRLP
jgi:hypothetical protein